MLLKLLKYDFRAMWKSFSLIWGAALALLLGLGRPLRAVLAALCWYGSLFTAVMAFPLSGAYLLLIGFSVPCLLGNFFLRTVLKPYCPPVSE